jgi:hypothetical protein
LWASAVFGGNASVVIEGHKTGHGRQPALDSKKAGEKRRLAEDDTGVTGVKVPDGFRERDVRGNGDDNGPGQRDPEVGYQVSKPAGKHNGHAVRPFDPIADSKKTGYPGRPLE